jgi:hypothetical protein
MELKVTCGLIDIGVGMNSGLRVVEEGDQSGPETVTASESAVGKLLPPRLADNRAGDEAREADEHSHNSGVTAA